MYLRIDNNYDIYERKIYSVMELLGDIGGLQGSLYMIGLFVIGFFSRRLFISAIMKNIYQVRKPIITKPEPNKDNKRSNS